MPEKSELNILRSDAPYLVKSDTFMQILKFYVLSPVEK